MVLHKDEEVLWTIVLEYLKTYVGRNGASESQIIDGCIEMYMRKYPEDCCYYLFYWDSALWCNAHWESCQGDLSQEIKRTLVRLAEHLPWIERHNSSATKYYVTLDREPKAIGKTKRVDEPKIDERQLEKSIIQAFKVLFEEGLSREREFIRVRRQDYVDICSKRRIIYTSIEQYIMDRKLCHDCLFDKKGYWELRNRLKLKIPNILPNIVKRVSFVQIKDSGHYTIKDYLPPIELKRFKVDRNLVVKLFFKILVEGGSPNIIHECLCSYVSAKKLDVTISRLGYDRFEGKDFPDPVDGHYSFQHMKAEFESIFKALRRKHGNAIEGYKLSKHFHRLDEFMNK